MYFGRYSSVPLVLCVLVLLVGLAERADAVVCNAGYYASGANCYICGVGTYGADGVSCTSCPTSMTTPYQGASGPSECYCRLGTYWQWDTARCTACPTNTYMDSYNVNGACYDCPAPYGNTGTGNQQASTCKYCAAGYGKVSTQCVACDYGYYKTATGDSACTKCNTGYTTDYTTSTAASACSTCMAGYYWDYYYTGKCLACPAEMYQPTQGQWGCNACPWPRSTSLTARVSESDCDMCVAGYEPDGYGGCKECLNGKYKAGINKNVCSSCSNTYSTPGTASTSSAACSVCAPGYYRVYGTTTCTVCPYGTYKDWHGTEECAPCPTGYTHTAQGATSGDQCYNGCNQGYGWNGWGCVECDQGTYKTTRDAVGCTACSTGYTTWETAATTSAKCITCTPGYWRTGGSCVKVPAGSYKDAIGDTYTLCNDAVTGYYAISTGSTSFDGCRTGCTQGYEFDPWGNCAQCGPGTYKSANNALQCTLCSGTRSNTDTYGAISSSSCNTCINGYYGSGTTCNACPYGTYKNFIANDVSCITCPTGYSTTVTAATDESQCNICDPGYENYYGCYECARGYYKASKSNTIACTACTNTFTTQYTASTASSMCNWCDAGNYITSANKCVGCPVDTVTTVDQSRSCDACAAGSSTEGRTGQTLCSCPAGQYSLGSYCGLCPAGTYKTGMGFTCTQCPAGKTTTGGTSTGVTVLSGCNTCTPGYYGDGNTCTACPIGTYKSATGNNITCLPCATGATTSTTGRASCNQCKPGYYGTAPTCTACPIGQFKAAASTSGVNCMDCATNRWTSMTASPSCDICNTGYQGTNCTACPTGTYKDTTSNSSCTACPAGKNTTSVGNKAITGCSKCLTGYVGNLTAFDQPCYAGCPKGSLTSTNMSCAVCDSGWSGAYCTNAPSGTCNAFVITKGFTTTAKSTPLIVSVNYTQNTLQVVMQSAYISDRKYTMLVVGAESGTSACSGYNATTYWTKDFDNNTCLDTFTLNMPWRQKSLCGFVKSSNSSSAVEFRGTVAVSYKDAIQNFSGKFNLTHANSDSYNVYVSFPASITVSLSSVSVVASSQFDVALSKESYNTTSEILSLELTTVVVYPSQLWGNVNLVTPPAVRQIGSSVLTNFNCTTKQGSVCVQKIRLSLQLTDPSICTFGGDYVLSSTLYQCRENNGSACLSSLATVSFLLASDSVCAKVNLNPTVSGDMVATNASNGTVALTKFKLGKRVFFNITTNAPNDNTVSLTIVRITYDDGKGAGPQALYDNQKLQPWGEAATLTIEKQNQFALWLSGNAFKFPIYSYQTYTFSVVCNITFTGNKKRSVSDDAVHTIYASKRITIEGTELSTSNKYSNKQKQSLTNNNRLNNNAGGNNNNNYFTLKRIFISGTVSAMLIVVVSIVVTLYNRHKLQHTEK